MGFFKQKFPGNWVQVMASCCTYISPAVVELFHEHITLIAVERNCHAMVRTPNRRMIDCQSATVKDFRATDISEPRLRMTSESEFDYLAPEYGYIKNDDHLESYRDLDKDEENPMRLDSAGKQLVDELSEHLKKYVDLEEMPVLLESK